MTAQNLGSQTRPPIPPSSHPATTTPQAQDPRAMLLSQMEDVKTPEAIGLWPLALGWWVLLAIILFSLYISVRLTMQRVRARAYKKYAVAALEQISQSDSDNATLCKAIMQVLKRTFFTAYPNSRNIVAGIYGKPWLHLLQQTSTPPMSVDKLGNDLEAALYGQDTTTSQFVEELSIFAKNWIRNHKPMSESVWNTILSTAHTHTKGDLRV